MGRSVFLTPVQGSSNIVPVMTKHLLLILFFSAGLLAQSKPLTIKECIDRTLSASISAKNSEQALQKAENDVAVNSAPFIPSLSARFNDTLVGYDSNSNQVPLFSFYPDTYSASLNLTYNIYNMGKDADKLLSYRKKKEEAELDLGKAKQDAAYSATSAYYSILKAQKSLLVREAVQKQRQENLKLTESLYKAGMRSKSIFLNSQISLGNSDLSILDGRNSLKMAKAELNTLMGQAPEAELEITDDIEYKQFELTYELALETAFKNRFEWLKLLLQKEESGISLALSERDLLPAVSVDGSYSLALDKYARDSSVWTHKGAIDQNSSWAVSLSISYPIFDGGVNSLQAENARISLRVVDLQLETLKRNMRNEVYFEWNDLARLFSSIPVYEKQAALSKENLEITRAKYREGSVSFLDLVDAEANYSSNQISYYQSIYDYKAQNVDLMRSIGLKLY